MDTFEAPRIALPSRDRLPAYYPLVLGGGAKLVAGGQPIWYTEVVSTATPVMLQWRCLAACIIGTVYNMSVHLMVLFSDLCGRRESRVI